MYAEKTDKVRYVGVFYWLWMGNNDHQFGVYDVTKLLSTPEGEQALFQTVNPPGDGMENAARWITCTGRTSPCWATTIRPIRG